MSSQMHVLHDFWMGEAEKLICRFDDLPSDRLERHELVDMALLRVFLSIGFSSDWETDEVRGLLFSIREDVYRAEVREAERTLGELSARGLRT